MDSFLKNTIPVDNEDLETFERKAEEVARLVQGLKDGTVDPRDVKVPGEKTEEERRADEAKATAKEVARRDLEIRLATKETKAWWERAEALQGMTRAEAEQHASTIREQNSKNVVGNGEPQVTEIRDDEGNLLFPKPKVTPSDILDYSHWDKWVPDDPASLEEMKQVKDKHDQEQMQEFEKNNAEFCEQYKQDQKEREKAKERKTESATTLKARGSRQYKAGNFPEALRLYHEALKVTPYDSTILTNISQTHAKYHQVLQSRKISFQKKSRNSENNKSSNADDTTQGNQSDTEVNDSSELENWEEDYHLSQVKEFCDRALFLDWNNMKALWRRAKLRIDSKEFELAVEDLSRAHRQEPENKEVERLLKHATEALLEQQAKRSVQEKLSKVAQRRKSLQIDGESNPVTKLADVMRDLMENTPTTLELVNEIPKLVQKLETEEQTEHWIMQTQLAITTLVDTLDPNDIDAHVLLRTSSSLSSLCDWTIRCEGTETPKHFQLNERWSSIQDVSWKLLCCAAQNNLTGKALLEYGNHKLEAVLHTLKIESGITAHQVHCLELLGAIMESVERQSDLFSSTAAHVKNWDALLKLLEISGKQLQEFDSSVAKVCSAAIDILFNLSNNGGSEILAKAMEIQGTPSRPVKAVCSLLSSTNIAAAQRGNLCGCIASFVCHPVLRSALEGEDATSRACSIVECLSGNGMAVKNLALAALLNWSGSSKLRTVQEVISTHPGGMDLLFDTFTGETVKGCLESDSFVRAECASRSASLFSRCSPMMIVDCIVRDPTKVEKLSITVSYARSFVPSNSYSVELLQNTVRIASAMSQVFSAKADGSSAALEIMCKMFESKLAQNVLNVLCDASKSIASGTDRFGIKSKKKVLVGNAAQFLISTLRIENQGFRKVLCNELKRMDIVSVVIDLLKNCADGPVRKNCAVAVAKLAKTDEFEDQVRKERGIQILMELGRRMVQ